MSRRSRPSGNDPRGARMASQLAPGGTLVARSAPRGGVVSRRVAREEL